MNRRQLEQIVADVADLVDGVIDLIRAPEQRRRRRPALLPLSVRDRRRRRR